MAFKKIDADCVNEEHPLDAFTLQGVAANLVAARDGRLRRASMAWPIDNRPVLAAMPAVVYPLCMWPMSDRTTEVTVTIRHTVSDAAVNLGVATLVSGVLTLSDSDLTQVGIGDATTALTIDVTGRRGEIPLFLIVKSELKDDAQSMTLDATAIIESHNRVHLPDEHGLTILENDGDRWVSYFENTNSGAGPEDNILLMAYRQIIQIEDADTDAMIWVSPEYSAGGLFLQMMIREGRLDASLYDFTVQTLGKTTVAGISMHESGVESFENLRGRLLPARAPVARNIRTLYHQAREIATEHTRLHHIGPTWDSDNTDADSNVISVWGEGPVPLSADLAYHNVAAAWVGNYARNNIDGGTTRYRNSLSVAGILMVATPAGEDLGMSIGVRATLYSWGGTEWDDDATTGSTTVIPVRGIAVGAVPADARESRPSTGTLINFSDDSDPPAHRAHYHRGAIPKSEIGDVELVPFSIQIDDDQTTASNRMLRVQVQVAELGSIRGTVKVYCSSISVWGTEGAYGT